MIIDITKCGYQRGYLPRQGIGAFHAFFPTANAAFRRQALQTVGGFDSRCATGEDIDLCIRIAQADYELWFEPTARVTHFHRYTLRGLARQWFQYGYGHAYLFRKHGAKHRVELYRYDRSETDGGPFGIARVLSIPFPIPGMIFLSSYHALHLGVIAALVAFGAGAHVVGWIALAAALLFAARYFGPRFNTGSPRRSLALAGIRYLADSAYVVGGVMGGITQRMIFLEATFRTRRGAPPRPRAGRAPVEPLSVGEASDAT